MRNDERWRLDRRSYGARWGSWLLIALAVGVAGAWSFLAVAHIDDRYRLDHVSGARIALVQYFNAGTLYPELYDGQLVGGTRFMPLPIVLHGLVARLTDDLLVAGKLMTYVVTVALLVTVFVIVRGRGVAVPVAMALSVLVLTTNTGMSSALNVRSDGLPLLLQLSAVWLVARTPRMGGTLGAAALAALAFVSKLSAVWAPLAIVVWLLFRDRRRLVVFSGAYLGLAAGLVLVFAAISDGRIFRNVFGLATSGIEGPASVALSPYRLLHLSVADATTVWALVPLACLGGWLEVRDRSPSIYLLGLVASVAVLLVTLIDVGTGWNQLLDAAVLTVIVAGGLAAPRWFTREPADGRTVRIASLAVTLSIAWMLGTGFVVELLPQLRATIAGASSYRPDPLAGIAASETTILSEDPYVPVSLGQTPIVLDPFMQLRLGRQRPEVTDDLVARVRAQEFDLVVLVAPLEPVAREWWQDQHFGVEVIGAISRAYTYAGRAQGYYVYEPVGDGG